MIIEPKHFEYLVLQCGDISDERLDLERWKSAYARRLDSHAASIRNGTERVREKVGAAKKAVSVLDVGGGLGGVHTRIACHFLEGYRLTILDGIDDPPIHRNSWQTFNNAAVGRDFLSKNGLNDVRYTDAVPHDEKFDLVISFFAYGFHIHPGNYLADLKKAVHSETVLIFDVRRAKKEWLRAFVEAFGVPKVLHEAEKYVRLAFNAG